MVTRRLLYRQFYQLIKVAIRFYRGYWNWYSQRKNLKPILKEIIQGLMIQLTTNNGVSGLGLSISASFWIRNIFVRTET